MQTATVNCAPPQEVGTIFQLGKLRLGRGTQLIQGPSRWQNQGLKLGVEDWVCATVHITSFLS